MNEKELEELIAPRQPSTKEELKKKAEAYILLKAKEAAGEGREKRLPRRKKK